MNQSDYKAIAGIVRKRASYGEPHVERIVMSRLVEDLADYFKKEDYMKELMCDCGCTEVDMGKWNNFHCVDCNKPYKLWTKSKKIKLHSFNREQFLKDCGVPE